MSKKQDLIFSLTEEFHEDVVNIYESSADGDNASAFAAVDELRRKLKAFKDNLINKDEI